MLAQLVVAGVAMVAALEGVRMYYAEFFVEHHTSTPLLVHIFKPILGFHVLSRKVALIKLKVDAVMA